MTLRLALEAAKRVYADEGGAVVSLSRYFLAETLSALGRHEEALEVVWPSIQAGSKTEAVLRSAEAEAHWALGHAALARAAALRAVEVAKSEGQRTNIRVRLKEILDASEQAS